MKNLSRISLAFVAIIVLLVVTSCKKKEIPVVSTTAVSNITVSGVTSGGNITSDGNAGVVSRGVCYGTAQAITITDPHTTDGSGSGTFVSTVAGLAGGTTYYVRAYATNSEGTGYGNAVSFKTPGSAPIVSTLDATALQTTGATLNGLVNASYLSTTVTFEYGLTASYGSTATASQSPVTGSTSTNVSAVITGLNPGSTYHFRVKTVNTIGTTYGDDKTFLTPGQVPTATTLAATDAQTTSGTFNGTVNANLLSSTVTFEYGLTTAYGSTVTATQSPVTGSTVTNVSANVTGLVPGTVYHFRVKAVNVLGTTNGDDLTLTTLGGLPTATTNAATNVEGLTAKLNGSVNANLVSTDVSFEYGLTTAYGSTTAAVPATVTGSTLTDVAADLTGLTPVTVYHFRVKAVNAVGTTYGDDMTLTTLGQAPITKTKIATGILSTSATLNGNVNPNWIPTTVTFEYGLDSNFGSTVTAAQSPLSGGIAVNVSATISGLTPSTTYYFRTKGENSLGVTYGLNLSFTTSAK
jgi:phosphodiesterase/alkaline phosphatase D-like protein